MRTTMGALLALALLLAAPAARAERGGLDVEVWTDRGTDAVYQPGNAMEVRVRSSEDGYLLVYEIDVNGYVRLLWPDRGHRGFIEGRRTLDVPSESSNLELVVEEPTGQGYLVALVSREPFRDLPWYLRPYNLQAEGTGYAGDARDEDGVTEDGTIVGDPFVAMERVRRRVLRDPDDVDAFGSSYTTYYVHERVRYPRYLCNDCHRPGYWAWWDGFDPYYSSCSVFEFRVNRGWYWGPTYWFGYVPYYYYVPRYDCPPRYRVYSTRSTHFSSWDGWPRWRSLLGSSIRRYKSPPPADYVPPAKYKERAGAPKPPGLLGGREVAPGRHGGSLRPVPEERRSPATRDGGRRIERPRDSDRGGSTVRPSTPARGRLGRDDSETDRPVRGMGDRSRAPAPDRDERPRIERSTVGRGRGGEARGVAPSREERPREVGRPQIERSTVGRGRSGEARGVAPSREERSREVERPARERAPERPQVDAPREEKKEEARPAPAPERKSEWREERRGGGRGRPGR